ncbi:MAG TPA: hypothetical protein VKT71_03030 [Candidatus Acidoferrales bacterium]|nr:hypothetical protein [Candidatus Acidoferrales bacterium]
MSEILDKVIAVSKPYFGPATQSFLSRQCKKHLNIELNSLTESHLEELAVWVKTSGALIMDSAKAADVAHKIAGLRSVSAPGEFIPGRHSR